MNTQEHEIEQFAHEIAHNGIKECSLGLQRRGSNPLAVFQGMPANPGEVLAQWVFGGIQFHERATGIMGNTGPLMWLQGDPCSGKHIASRQVMLIKGASVTHLKLDGRIVGSAWSDADADYCFLAGIQPADISVSRGEQTRQVYERMESVLQQAGMGFLDIVRTWLYLDHLLDWYGEFNAVRTQFYQERGVFENRVPASTGIGAGNPSGSAIVAGALAVRPKHKGVTITVVPSPLQCPALNYKASFSRAIELGFPGRRQLLVSGTASIAPGGDSIHKDDVTAQIELTMKVIEAILASRDMTWQNTTRAIAYFRDMKDAPLMDDWCRSKGLTRFPVVNAHATVCRSVLLFELELDAIAAVR